MWNLLTPDLAKTSNVEVTEQVRRSNFSKIVIFGVHNLCGVGFLMQKKKSPKSLFTLELL